MTSRARALLLAVLAVGLLVGSAGPASAGLPDLPGIPDVVKNVGTVGGLVGGDLTDQVSEAICPGKKAPHPQTPELDTPWSHPGGQTQFQRYGYAGLQVTTFEQGCMAQIKTGTAQSLNDLANTIDSLFNSLQVSAVNTSSVGSVDRVLPQALLALRDTFWTPWMPAVAALGGLLILLLGMRAQSSAAIAVGINLVAVLGITPWLLGHSDVVTGMSDRMTAGVAQQTSQSLMKLHPSEAGDSAGAAYGDGYYQMAWRAHLNQQFGGFQDCATKYGPQFVPTQAYSYDEVAQIEHDKAAGDQLLKAKQTEWLRLADTLKKDDPACFDAWSTADGAFGAVMKHAVTTLMAGTWVAILSLAVVGLRFVLRFGLILVAFLGLLALVKQQLTASYASLLLAGIVGPPVLAAGAGSMLFWFYVIISDPGTGWVQAIISGVGMGVGALLAMRWLGPAVIGFTAVSWAHASGSKHSRRAGRTVRHNSGRHAGGGAARAAATGAAVGAAVAAASSPDATAADSTTSDDVDTTSAPDSAPTPARRRPASRTASAEPADVDPWDSPDDRPAQQPDGMALPWADLDGPVPVTPARPSYGPTSPEKEPALVTIQPPRSPNRVNLTDPADRPGTEQPSADDPRRDSDLVTSTYKAYAARLGRPIGEPTPDPAYPSNPDA